MIRATPSESEVRVGGVPSPESKVTAPVGTPAPGATGATVAVRVTGWPTTDRSGAVTTVVSVDAGSTV
ncbi:hypothetical protein BG653_05645 [Streptomyces platensis]|uniref:Uncharacterized protein n=1 Tax=Streptomyces platensis TaxID=58346 RepID=A0ABX3XQS8_STRPT|nr:hypothetical protein BG653_05645 [Streptomyces platensis]